MKIKKKTFSRSHSQKNDTSFCQMHGVTLQKITFTPSARSNSQDNLRMLKLTNLKYLLRHLLLFLLFLKSCGVGDRLDKIMDEVLFCWAFVEDGTVRASVKLNGSSVILSDFWLLVMILLDPLFVFVAYHGLDTLLVHSWWIPWGIKKVAQLLVSRKI